MLKERGVAPFSKWDKELPKIVFDPRFKVSDFFVYAFSLSDISILYFYLFGE